MTRSPGDAASTGARHSILPCALARGKPERLDDAALSYLERRQRLGEEGVHVGEAADAIFLDDARERRGGDRRAAVSIVTLERLQTELGGRDETSVFAKSIDGKQRLRVRRAIRYLISADDLAPMTAPR